MCDPGGGQVRGLRFDGFAAPCCCLLLPAPQNPQEPADLLLVAPCCSLRHPEGTQVPSGLPKGIHRHRWMAQTGGCCSKKLFKKDGSATLHSASHHSAPLHSVHGYAQVHSSIYIYIYIYIYIFIFIFIFIYHGVVNLTFEPAVRRCSSEPDVFGREHRPF